MAIIDSEASFISRALSFGVEQSDLDLLKVQKYCSFGAFTFIATYHQSDDKPLKDVLTDLLGAEPTNAAMGKWRRLHFEAHAITVSDAKSRVEGTSDDAPKTAGPRTCLAVRNSEEETCRSGLDLFVGAVAFLD